MKPASNSSSSPNENRIEMKLSVVIPVLNERASLPATIAALRACRGIAEIIVFDGGSIDGTVQWLQA